MREILWQIHQDQYQFEFVTHQGELVAQDSLIQFFILFVAKSVVSLKYEVSLRWVGE